MGVGCDLAEWLRLLVQNPVDDRVRQFAGKGLGVGHQLVQDDADGKHIGAMIDGVALDLLRRHVAWRTERHSRVGCCSDHPRDAEVENLEPPRFVDHQVGRLDIAMHHRHAMGIRHAGQQLFHPAQLVDQGDGKLPPDDLGKGLTGDILHDDVRLTVEVAEVVHRDDVGMAEGRRRTGLAREACAGVRHLDVGRKHLDRDHATEHRVVRHVHGSHATASELAMDFVTPDERTRFDQHPLLTRKMAKRGACVRRKRRSYANPSHGTVTFLR